MNWNPKDIISNLKSNRKSGLVVAIVTIPLSISLAIASGATPVQGLITAIWSSLIASIFASSGYNVFGPAGALSGILLWASMIYWPEYLPLIALFSGAMMAIVYAFKLTKYITLIPAAGLQWFLFAVGIWIFVGQLPSGLGLNIHLWDKVYLNFWSIIQSIPQADRASVVTFLGGMGILFVLKKFLPKVPWAIILSLIGIVLGWLSTHGMYPAILLLSQKYPNLSFQLIQNNPRTNYLSIWTNIPLLFGILKVASVVAVVTILETIISGKLAEKQSGQKFNKDREVLGNWLANIGSGLFGGFPATAVFIRTSLNMKTWATSKYSGFLVGVFALLISVLLFNNAFSYLPMPIIAAILCFIAIGIMDFHILKKFYKFKKTSFALIIVTIFFSVVEDTIIGILVGTALSLLVFVKRVSEWELNVTIFRNKEFFKKTTLLEYLAHQDIQDTVIVKFVWEINYLNSENYINQIKKIKKCDRVILAFAQLSDMDIDAMEALEEVLEHFNRKKIKVILTGLNNPWIKRICMRLPAIKQLEKEGKIYPSTSELLGNI